MTEHPEWRRSAMPTSEMVKAIAAYNGTFRATGSKAICQSMVEDFVFHVNFLNFEGCDTIEETRQCIAELTDSAAKRARKIWEDCGAEIRSRSRRGAAGESTEHEEKLKATRNLFHAYCVVSQQWSSFPVLRLSYIKQLHYMLFRDRSSSAGGDGAGIYRHKEVYVRMPDFSYHTFLAPQKIELALQELVGEANTELEDIFASGDDAASKARRLLRLASSFFLRFERIHPFIDGNGRVGRLLVAYLVSWLTPFGPYNLYLVDTLQSGRARAAMADLDLHLSCFREGNASTSDPSRICAMLTEGIYVGWKLFLEMNQTQSTQVAQM